MDLQITSENLLQAATDPDGIYLIHRGAGNHEHSLECWCAPLALTYDQVKAHSKQELTQLLATHNRVH